MISYYHYNKEPPKPSQNPILINKAPTFPPPPAGSVGRLSREGSPELLQSLALSATLWGLTKGLQVLF